mmetsp:Transcript_14606/g.30737  ORF Transcript_14606/g.30737 Transcript_14606/m.30737 type:complete len:118 (-) Transcript_14606:1363-1716(-)
MRCVLVPSKAVGQTKPGHRPTLITAALFAVHLASMSVLLEGSNYLSMWCTMVADSNFLNSTWMSFGTLISLVPDLLAASWCRHGHGLRPSTPPANSLHRPLARASSSSSYETYREDE